MPRFAKPSRYPFVAKQKAAVQEFHKALLPSVLRGDWMSWCRDLTRSDDQVLTTVPYPVLIFCTPGHSIASNWWTVEH